MESGEWVTNLHSMDAHYDHPIEILEHLRVRVHLPTDDIRHVVVGHHQLAKVSQHLRPSIVLHGLQQLRVKFPVHVARGGFLACGLDDEGFTEEMGLFEHVLALLDVLALGDSLAWDERQ